MSEIRATNALSSGIRLDREVVRALARRSDRPGLVWLAAWAVLVIHVLLAFHWVHHWEHDAAIEHTAEMTQRVIGWYWAGGLCINYAFILLWGFDAVRCVRSHSSTSGVTMQVISGFMWFNATVVFGTLWWLLPLALWMLGCGLLLRQPAELTRHSEAMKRTRVD